MKTVFMACTHPYSAPVKVGSHYFAEYFLKSGWRVVYVSAPVTPLHLILVHDENIRKRLRTALRGGCENYGPLLSCIPFSFIAPAGRPFLNGNFVTQNWHRTIFPSTDQLIKRAGIDSFDLLYIDNIFQRFWLDSIPHKQAVFRVMDEHETFPGWKGKAKHIAASIAQRVDVTIYSAKSLEPYARSLDPKRSYFVPNGVDYELFQTSGGDIRNELQRTLSTIRTPIALYIGAIDHRLDICLLQYAAEVLPGVTFCLAGPIHTTVSRKKLPKNIKFVGPVHHEQTPVLMQRADVGLIPFDVLNCHDRITGIRPLKLLEYCAAGLPVVCARWPEVQEMESPAFLYDTLEGFIEALKAALENPPPPEVAKAFAKKHDWSQSLAEFMKALLSN